MVEFVASVIDRFVITGLPRSRTSWCANFFTYGPCFCLHDALAKGMIASSMEDAARDAAICHFGVSDSGYLLLDTDAWALGLKVVLVRRELKEAWASFLEFFKKPYPGMKPPEMTEAFVVLSLMEKRLNQISNLVPKHMLHVVEYSDLNYSDKCCDLWNFICPEVPFSLSRWLLLDELRINPATEKANTFALRFADVRRKAVA